jgi:VanZ family protein
MKSIFNFIYFYRTSLIVVGVILYLSFAPSSTFSKIPSFNHEDKLVHCFMYFCLSIILLYECKKRNGNFKYEKFLLGFIFPIILGAIIEVLQPMYFQRSGSFFDLIANILGIIFSNTLFRNLVKHHG